MAPGVEMSYGRHRGTDVPTAGPSPHHRRARHDAPDYADPKTGSHAPRSVPASSETKNATAASRRNIFIGATTAEALRRHRAAQAEERLSLGDAWDDHDLAFPNGTGRPVNPSNLLIRSYRVLLDRAGVPRIRFHHLRHTAATLMLGRGVHPKIVSEMLGHSTVTITLDLYSRVTPTMQQQAADALDDLLSAPLAVNLAVSEDDEGSKPQVSPRGAGAKPVALAFRCHLGTDLADFGTCASVLWAQACIRDGI